MNAKLALEIIMWHLRLSAATFGGSDSFNTERYWGAVFPGKLYLTHEVKVGHNDYDTAHDHIAMRHQLVGAAVDYLADKIDRVTP